MVLVPNSDPITVAAASASNILLTFSIFPFSSIISASFAQATIVPTESNRSTNINENIGPIIDIFKAPNISNLKAIGAMLGGVDIIPFGNSTYPKTIPKIVVISIPIKIPPFTCFISSPTIIVSPVNPKITVGLRDPNPTRVAGLATINPKFCIPINAINNPIPAPTANLS